MVGTVQTHLRGLDKELYQQLRVRAIELGYRYPSQLLNEIIRAWLAQQNGKE